VKSTSKSSSDLQFAIAARQTRLRLEHNDGGTQLISLADADGREYLRRPNILWKIEMIDRQKRIVELDMRQSPPKLRNGNDQVRLTWRNVHIASTSERVTVKALIHLNDENGEIAFRLAVEDVPADWSVFRVHFPRLDLAVTPGCQTDCLVVPDDRGVLYRDPLSSMPTGGIHEKLRRRPYPHGSFTMQFLALQREDQLLYMAAHDPAGHLKNFFIGPDPDNELVYIHPWVDTEIHYGQDWSQPFPWILRLQRGDWYDAAQIYRKFALTADWTKPGPLVEGRKTPLWYQRIGLVTLRLMRGPAFEDEDVIAEHAFMNTPMVCHYYLWHQNAFDAQYPFFFPAVPTFRDTIKKFQARGIHTMPYINMWSCDMQMPAWEQGMKHCALQITPAGDLDTKVWSQNRSFSVLCPSTDLTRRISQLTAMRLFEQGASAVYFDEIAMSAAWPCHDTHHGHPAGGGTTFVKSINQTLALIREEAAQVYPQGPVLTTEGCAEPYIGQFDALLMGNAIRGNAIPLFETVYHDHVMAFGRYTWTPELMDPKFAGAIESKHAQQFVFGSQIGWCDIPLSLIIEKSPQTASFLRHLAHTWTHSYDFLAQGRMLRPLDLSDQLQPITRRWATSWQDAEGTEVKLSPVLNGVFLRVDGSIGVVLVNITTDAISLTVRLPSPQSMYAQAMKQGAVVHADEATLSHYYPLPQRTGGEIRTVIDGQFRKSIADGDSERGFELSLNPLSCAIVTLGSEKPYGLS
jgi:hypothetical protein